MKYFFLKLQNPSHKLWYDVNIIDFEAFCYVGHFIHIFEERCSGFSLPKISIATYYDVLFFLSHTYM